MAHFSCRQWLSFSCRPTQAKDAAGNTLLHVAARNGDLKVTTLLLKFGASVTAMNKSGKRPADLATENIKYLFSSQINKIRKELSTFSQSSFSQTSLHDAAAQGEGSEIIKLLQQNAEVDARNERGETPLHFALRNNHLRAVALLIKAGARADLATAEGKTAMDLVRGKAKLASILIWGEAAPAINSSINRSAQKTSLETSKPTQGDQKSASSSLLSSQSQKKIGSNFVVAMKPHPSAPLPRPGFAPIDTVTMNTDHSGVAYVAFEAAYEKGDIASQLLSLEEMAMLQRDQGSLIKAAHIYSAAIVIAEKSNVNPHYIDFLFDKLEELEERLLWDRCKLPFPPTYQNSARRHRNTLQQIRSGIELRMKNKVPIDRVQKFTTQSNQSLLCTMIRECFTLLGGKVPQGFSVVGLGSLARNEMSPYSDVEFAFLIDDTSKERMAYFEALNQLLTLKMINIGESKFDIIRPKRVNKKMHPPKSITPAGFSMDIGGLCPSGKQGIYRLVGTPEELAQFQAPTWLSNHESEIILVNAMTTVRCVMGDESLLIRYQKEVDRILNASISKPKQSKASSTSSSLSSSSQGVQNRLFVGGATSSQLRVREHRAIALMKGYIEEFQPRLDESKIALRAFDVKWELYRLPQTIVSGLCLYSGIKQIATLDRIDELQRKRILSPSGATRLKNAFDTILRWRVKTHLFYGQEKEHLFHARDKNDQEAAGLFHITKEMNKEIIEIYRTLHPLHQCAIKFIKGDRRAFATDPLYDKSVGSYDDKARQDLNYKSAKQLAVSHSALEPNNPFARQALGLVQGDLGQVRNALRQHQEALVLLKKRHKSKPHLEVANAQENLGIAYKDLGDFERAAECIEEALSIRRILEATKPSSERGFVLMNLGSVYGALGRFEEAIKLFKASQSMQKKTNHQLSTALGTAYNALRKPDQALQTLQVALKTAKKMFSNKAHPEIAMVWKEMGSAYLLLQNPDQASMHFKHALTTLNQVFDSEHPKIAMVMVELATSIREAGRLTEAAELFEKALVMQRKIYSAQSYPGAAYLLTELARTYALLGNTEKAMGLYKESLKNSTNQKGAIIVHVELGDLFAKEGVTNLAIKSYKEALSKYSSLYAESPHPLIAKAFFCLGNSYVRCQKYQLAVESYRHALVMSRQIYGKESHPNVSVILHNLRSASNITKQVPPKSTTSGSAIKTNSSLFQLLNFFLEEMKKKHGANPHKEVAVALYKIGNAHFKSGNFSKAIEFYKKAVEMFRSINKGKPHSDLVNVLRNLGMAHAAHTQIQQAIECYEESRSMGIEIHQNRPHIEVTRTLEKLGESYYRIGEGAKAVKVYEQLLRLYKQLNPNRPTEEEAETLMSIGLVLQHSLKKHAKAAKYFELALAMQKKLSSSAPNRKLGMTMLALGISYISLGRERKGEEMVRSAHRMLVLVGGDYDPDAGVAKRKLESLLERQKKRSTSSSSSFTG